MTNTSPKRILMIGGTALLGPHVLRSLTQTAQVFTLTRTGKPITFETALQGNRRDPDTLKRAFDTARPDLIIDMIPFTAQDAEILCAFVPRNIPIIALSSADVYQAYGLLHGTETGPPQPCPIAETGTLRRSLGPEGEAYNKPAVERIFSAHFQNLTTLRMPAIYGWPDTTRVLPYLDTMLSGTEITLTAHRSRFRFSRALHKNCAHAVILASNAAQRGQHTYNVAEPTAFSELEWAQTIASHAGWTGKITITPRR